MTLDPTGSDSAPASRQARRFRSAEDVRDRRRRLIILGLSLALCVLLVNAIVGENGYLAALSYRSEEAALQASVARLRIENQRLQEEGRRLLEDPSALEEAARRSLGLVRPGETVIIVRPAQAPRPEPSSR